MKRIVLRVILIVSCLIATVLFVLSLVYPDFFTIVFDNSPVFAVFGEIDKNVWLHSIIEGALTLAVYWVYFATVLKKWIPTGTEITLVILIIIVEQILFSLAHTEILASIISVVFLITMPAVEKISKKEITIIFFINYFAHLVAGLIRNLPMLIERSICLAVLYFGVCVYTNFLQSIELKKYTGNIYAMSKDELYKHCRLRGLDDADCKIAEMIVIEHLKGEALYHAIGYSERQTKRKRAYIIDKIK